MRIRFVVAALVLAASGAGLVFVSSLREDQAAAPDPSIVSHAAPPRTAPAAVVLRDRAVDTEHAESERSVGTSAPVGVATWDDLYRNSADYFSFVETSALAAINGDGRAQWLLFRALMQCQLEMATAEEVQHGRLPGHLAATPRARRCERFRDANPLDTFDLPEDAKSFAYWRDQALAAQDANAVMLRATRTASALSSETDAATKAELHRQLLDDVRIVVESQEPEALLSLTSLFMDPNLARDDSQWVAWTLAACELGYDCSQPMPAIRDECSATGACTAVTTVLDMIQQHPKLVSQQAAEVYAAGQEIAQKVRTGDWDGLQPFLEMKP